MRGFPQRVARYCDTGVVELATLSVGVHLGHPHCQQSRYFHGKDVRKGTPVGQIGFKLDQSCTFSDHWAKMY